ncbi:unnamed protein product, partial [Prorocentrum cordatum]
MPNDTPQAVALAGASAMARREPRDERIDTAAADEIAKDLLIMDRWDRLKRSQLANRNLMRLVAPIVETVPALAGTIGDRDVTFFEVLANSGRLSEQCATHGVSQTFDSSFGPEWDITTDMGWQQMLRMSLKLKAGGVAWIAPPEEATSGKTYINGKSSLVVSRLVAMSTLLWLRGGQLAWSHSVQSYAWRYPPVEELRNLACTYTTKTNLRSYGHKLLKEFIIRHSCPEFYALEKNRLSRPRTSARDYHGEDDADILPWSFAEHVSQVVATIVKNGACQKSIFEF